MNAFSAIVSEVDYDLQQELERRRRDGSLITAKQLMIYEEITLPNMARVIGDDRAPYAVRADLMKFSAKLVGEGVDKAPTAAPAFTLAINLPGNPEPALIIEATANTPDPVASGLVREDEPDPLRGLSETFDFDPLGFTPDYVPERFPLIPDLCMAPEHFARVP
jgi:hypothetical protein